MLTHLQKMKDPGSSRVSLPLLGWGQEGKGYWGQGLKWDNSQEPPTQLPRAQQDPGRAVQKNQLVYKMSTVAILRS